ncbi:kinase-like protein [Fomitiporia mediterranea MF3/22]|uniref:kinase-like protein n=1 Tax=Fomitiporia mediterranea (strain MF3/22) TaxID=694068 RepID=UPI0004408376|nr:kinase-like protein [Fomitiporia mediterranea MF3/22]EJD04678.1 kinase-like protein [Fomitiporia mediterranea MF3/22]
MKEWVGEGKFGKIGLIERDDVVEGETLKLAAKVTWKKKNPDGKLRSDEKKNENAKKFAIKEARILAQIRCYGAFENDDSWIIVLEYAGGNTLLHRLNHVQRVSEESMAHYSRCYLLSVIPGDHPYNSFGSKADICSGRISSFKGSRGNSQRLKCGTPPYMAPEMTTKAKAETYTEKVDLWSLGVLVFEMVTAMSVYSNVHAQEIAKGTPVKFNEYNVASIITDTHVEKHVLPYCRYRIDDDGKEILQHCLKVNPYQRKSAEELQSMAEKV